MPIFNDGKGNEAAAQFDINISDENGGENTDHGKEEVDADQMKSSFDQDSRETKQSLTVSSEYGSFNSQVRNHGAFGLIAEARELLNAMVVE